MAQYQYTVMFKTIKFDDKWTYGPLGENIVYTPTSEDEGDPSCMWIMIEGPDGHNVAYEFHFTKKDPEKYKDIWVVGVSLYENLVVIPKSETDVIIH